MKGTFDCVVMGNSRFAIVELKVEGGKTAAKAP